MTAEQCWANRPDLHTHYSSFPAFALAYVLGEKSGLLASREIIAKALTIKTGYEEHLDRLEAQFVTPAAINGTADRIAK